MSSVLKWPYGHCLLLLLACLFLILPPATVAQSDNSSIAGVVTDPSGAVIGNASVTVTSEQTGAAHEATSNGSGYYMNGVNFEGPTPRPLERFAISKDADGFVNVDMRTVYRQELGEWDSPQSFIALG